MTSEAVGVIVDLLNDNWINSNTNDVKPTISQITDEKRVDLNSADFVLCWEENLQNAPAGIDGNVNKYENVVVVIDMRTMRTSGADTIRAHGHNIRNEVGRILDKNMENPDVDWNHMDPDFGDDRNLSDKTRGMYRVLTKCRIWTWRRLRGT